MWPFLEEINLAGLWTMGKSSIWGVSNGFDKKKEALLLLSVAVYYPCIPEGNFILALQVHLLARRLGARCEEQGTSMA